MTKLSPGAHHQYGMHDPTRADTLVIQRKTTYTPLPPIPRALEARLLLERQGENERS